MRIHRKIVISVMLLIALVLSACGAKSDAALDYSDMKNWAMYAEGSGDADVFFVCPTVDMGKDGNRNMSMEDEETKESFIGASKMELGIYNENAAVYVPYYRQATFPVYKMTEKESKPYFETAYKDIKAAFETYLKKSDASRPLILAGFSQGADMIIRLLEEFGNKPSVSDRLVAAYALGWRLTKDEVEKYPHLVPARGEDDIGCIVMFDCEQKGITDTIIIPEGVWTYSINPLNWKTDDTPAAATDNLGACFTDYSGAILSEVPALTSAVINPERGSVICTEINPDDYANALFPNGEYHLFDYQFFYRNLQRNVAVRLNAWQQQHQQSSLDSAA